MNRVDSCILFRQQWLILLNSPAGPARTVRTDHPGLTGRILWAGCVGATATILWQRRNMTTGGARLGLASVATMWAGMGVVAYDVIMNQ